MSRPSLQQSASWYAPDFDHFLVAHWEDEYFLFNPRTAHTHVFNRLGMEMLRGLARQPLDLDGVQRLLLGDDAAPDTELQHSLREQLAQFVVMGLAEKGR